MFGCILITKYCHCNILPSQHFATATFNHHNIMPLLKKKRRKTNCYHQYFTTKIVCHQRHCATRHLAALTMCHQDMVQHFVVIMVIVMLVVVLYNLGFDLVPSYGSLCGAEALEYLNLLVPLPLRQFS